MDIIRCHSTHQAQWNAYVDASPRASFYHRWEWRDIITRNFGHEMAYLAAVDAGQIVGIFPLVRLKSLVFGNVACSMPFVNYGGPCGDTDEIEDALMQEAATTVDAWKVDYLEVRSRRPLGDRFPSALHKVSMTIALTADAEAQWAHFKTSQQKEIRKAYKNGFTARFGAELLDDFYAILSESWHELGTPLYRRHYLRSVLEAFPDSTRLCIVYAADGTPAAGAFDGLHNRVVEGMWLGIRGAYRKQLVGYVLYWELIKNACERGFAQFHLGRSSKDTGAEQFKKKWNAESVQLYWQYILRTRQTIPELNPSNRKYQWAIQTWRRLPLPVTQVLGPFIARSIP